MRVSARFVSVLITVVMALSGLSLVGAPSASADNYAPVDGVIFNNPTGSKASKYAIRKHLIRSIYSTPHYGRIRIMSWNIRSHAVAYALVKAHLRGVSVQIVMDKINTIPHDLDPNNPIPADNGTNPDYWWMKRQFSLHNEGRGPAFKSFARTCRASCRGHGGLPHTKMMMFNPVHNTPFVVMWTSGNVTDAASTVQWNDMYTSVKRRDLWSWAMFRFNEMARDRAVAQPWQFKAASPILFGLFPWRGAGTWGDPVVRALNTIKCTGAVKPGGDNHGRTIVRIAQTALNDARGRAIAYKLKSLYNHGCNIRMVYGLMGPTIRKILMSRSGRGPVPMRQMAQDFDGDFIYDRYLHQKSMAVSGYVGKSRSANFVWNGSANWTGYTLASDEVFTRIGGRAAFIPYFKNIDYWFTHVPRSARGQLPASYARLAGVDPYAKFDLN